MLEREPFRHRSYVADVAVVHVVGEGVPGYAKAAEMLIDLISSPDRAADGIP